MKFCYIIIWILLGSVNIFAGEKFSLPRSGEYHAQLLKVQCHFPFVEQSLSNPQNKSEKIRSYYVSELKKNNDPPLFMYEYYIGSGISPCAVFSKLVSSEKIHEVRAEKITPSPKYNSITVKSNIQNKIMSSLSELFKQMSASRSFLTQGDIFKENEKIQPNWQELFEDITTYPVCVFITAWLPGGKKVIYVGIRTYSMDMLNFSALKDDFRALYSLIYSISLKKKLLKDPAINRFNRFLSKASSIFSSAYNLMPPNGRPE